jgi:hypothetical protein
VYAPLEGRASVRCLGLLIAACSCEQKVNFRCDAGDPDGGGSPPPRYVEDGPSVPMLAGPALAPLAAFNR